MTLLHALATLWPKMKHHMPMAAILLAIFCFCSVGYAQAQEEIKPVMVGLKLPDGFWTKKHLFYVDGDTVRKDLSEYRGKLLVFDFWATWCGICLGQMKDKQTLFSQYPDEAALLLVNPSVTKDTYNTVLEKQEKIADRSLGGKVESIIEDTYLQALFPNRIYPRYVWISPRGSLIALTIAPSVTADHIESLLNKLNKRYVQK